MPRFERLQAPVLIAAALVVQAPADGFDALRPHLIDDQLADRHRILSSRIDRPAIEHQRVGRVLAVIGNDQALGHFCRSCGSCRSFQSGECGNQRTAIP